MSFIVIKEFFFANSHGKI